MKDGELTMLLAERMKRGGMLGVYYLFLYYFNEVLVGKGLGELVRGQVKISSYFRGGWMFMFRGGLLT